MDATTVGLRASSKALPIALKCSGRSRDIPGSCRTLAGMPRSVTPADPTHFAMSVRSVWPSVQKTTSAPPSVSFRGSITRPTSPLCTLRSRGRPRTTQHSVPVGGYPLPGQDLHLRVLTEGFDMSFLHIPSSFSRLALAHFPRNRPCSELHPRMKLAWEAGLPGRALHKFPRNRPCSDRDTTPP
jgi:hypothetical protein